jgi:hypothetical protein
MASGARSRCPGAAAACRPQSASMPRGAALDSRRFDGRSDLDEALGRRVDWVSSAACRRQSRPPVHIRARRAAFSGSARRLCRRRPAGSGAGCRRETPLGVRWSSRTRDRTTQKHRRIRAHRRTERGAGAVALHGDRSAVSRRGAHAAACRPGCHHRACRIRPAAGCDVSATNTAGLTPCVTDVTAMARLVPGRHRTQRSLSRLLASRRPNIIHEKSAALNLRASGTV